MKRLVISAACGAAMMLGTAGAAFATPNTGPSAPSCHGGDLYIINHVIAPSLGVHGAANAAEALGLTVQQGQALVRAECSATP